MLSVSDILDKYAQVLIFHRNQHLQELDHPEILTDQAILATTEASKIHAKELREYVNCESGIADIYRRR